MKGHFWRLSRWNRLIQSGILLSLWETLDYNPSPSREGRRSVPGLLAAHHRNRFGDRLQSIDYGSWASVSSSGTFEATSESGWWFPIRVLFLRLIFHLLLLPISSLSSLTILGIKAKLWHGGDCFDQSNLPAAAARDVKQITGTF